MVAASLSRGRPGRIAGAHRETPLALRENARGVKGRRGWRLRPAP